MTYVIKRINLLSVAIMGFVICIATGSLGALSQIVLGDASILSVGTFFHALVGLPLSIFMAWFYNLTARFFGGLVVEVEPIDP